MRTQWSMPLRSSPKVSTPADRRNPQSPERLCVYTMIITERKRKSNEEAQGNLRRSPRSGTSRLPQTCQRSTSTWYAERWMIRAGLAGGGEREDKNAQQERHRQGSAFSTRLYCSTPGFSQTHELTEQPTHAGRQSTRLHADDMKVIMRWSAWSMEGGKPQDRSALPLLHRCHMPDINTAPPLQRQSLRGRLPQ